jgi:hypothetical protein
MEPISYSVVLIHTIFTIFSFWLLEDWFEVIQFYVYNILDPLLILLSSHLGVFSVKPCVIELNFQEPCGYSPHSRMPYNTTPIPPPKEAVGQAQLPCEFYSISLSFITLTFVVSRVKKIISLDSDISMCSNNAAFVITVAAVWPLGSACGDMR